MDEALDTDMDLDAADVSVASDDEDVSLFERARALQAPGMTLAEAFARLQQQADASPDPKRRPGPAGRTGRVVECVLVHDDRYARDAADEDPVARAARIPAALGFTRGAYVLEDPLVLYRRRATFYPVRSTLSASGAVSMTAAPTPPNSPTPDSAMPLVRGAMDTYHIFVPASDDHSLHRDVSRRVDGRSAVRVALPRGSPFEAHLRDVLLARCIVRGEVPEGHARDEWHAALAFFLEYVDATTAHQQALDLVDRYSATFMPDPDGVDTSLVTDAALDATINAALVEARHATQCDMDNRRRFLLALSNRLRLLDAHAERTRDDELTTLVRLMHWYSRRAARLADRAWVTTASTGAMRALQCVLPPALVEAFVTPVPGAIDDGGYVRALFGQWQLSEQRRPPDM